MKHIGRIVRYIIRRCIRIAFFLMVCNSLIGCVAPGVKKAAKEVIAESSIADAIPEAKQKIENALPDVKPTEVIQNVLKTPVSTTSTSTDIWYIDVGQGDSTLITNGDGHGILIDTGAYWGYDNVRSVLSEANVNTIDSLILTHPDADHIQNADEILNDYQVINVIMPDIEKDTTSSENLQNALQSSTCNVVHPEGKISIPFGDALVEIWSPKGVYEDINSYSLITKLTKGAKTFLFLGDATGEEIAELNIDYAADVMKAAHHGSANCGCNSEDLLNKVDPEYFVISCGYQNDYGHPHRETMAMITNRNIPTFRTDLQGTVHCSCDGQNIVWNIAPTDILTCGSDM